MELIPVGKMRDRPQRRLYKPKTTIACIAYRPDLSYNDMPICIKARRSKLLLGHFYSQKLMRGRGFFFLPYKKGQKTHSELLYNYSNTRYRVAILQVYSCSGNVWTTG